MCNIRTPKANSTLVCLNLETPSHASMPTVVHRALLLKAEHFLINHHVASIYFASPSFPLGSYVNMIQPTKYFMHILKITDGWCDQPTA